MAIRNSLTIQGAKDDDRLTGFTLPSDPTAVGGLVVCKDPSVTTSKALKRFDGTAALSATNQRPMGLLFEAATGYPGIAANGDTAAGRGFDTQDYAKGGLFSVAHRPGNIMEVYDDKRNLTQIAVGGADQNTSCPFVNAETFAPGQLFADASGRLSQVQCPVGGSSIGWLHDIVGGTGQDRILVLEIAPERRQA